MSRRLAAVVLTLALAAPAAARAQGYDRNDHRGGGHGGFGGFGVEPRGGYGAPGSHAPWGGPDNRNERGPAPPALRRGPPEGWSGAPARETWRRGGYLPPEARNVVIWDFDRYHLRRPPRGYYWYRAGDDFILAAVASGVIFEVIPAEGY